MSYVDDGDDFGHADPLAQELRQFVDLEEDDQDSASPGPSYFRDAPIALPQIYAKECRLLDRDLEGKGPRASTVKPGDAVELDNGTFMRVFYIIEDVQTDDIKLRGLLFKRDKSLAPALPRRLNEVHLVVSFDEDDLRPWYEQGLEEVELGNVVKKRRLVLTSRPFPEQSFREHRYFSSTGADAKKHQKKIYETENLVCRNLFASIYAPGERAKNRRKPYHGILRPLLPHEDDATDAALKEPGCYRVDVDIGGNATVPADNNNGPHVTKYPSKARKYTMADTFMGAGGASSGARQAGLLVVYGFDHNEDAVATARVNFPTTKVYHMSAQDFIQQVLLGRHVDILHISPPCQPYSPANTNPSVERDEENTAALFCVEELIKKIKPRIVTLEETFGLMTYEKHELWFQGLLAMIQRKGYNIRWGILEFNKLGLAQPRRRLVIFATAPGIPLPNFPKPTHGEPGSGLIPFRTIHDTIGNLPPNLDLHDIYETKARSYAPYNAHEPLKRTILTNGDPDLYHPNGRRDFTLRELALLQGFKRNFKFEGGKTSIKRQIGNACPPSVMKLLYQECIKVLEKVDGNSGDMSESPRSGSTNMGPCPGPAKMGQRQRPFDTPSASATPTLVPGSPTPSLETLRRRAADSMFGNLRTPKRRVSMSLIDEQETPKKLKREVLGWDGSVTVSRPASPPSAASSRTLPLDPPSPQSPLGRVGLDGYNETNAILIDDEGTDAKNSLESSKTFSSSRSVQHDNGPEDLAGRDMLSAILIDDEDEDVGMLSEFPEVVESVEKDDQEVIVLDDDEGMHEVIVIN